MTSLVATPKAHRALSTDDELVRQLDTSQLESAMAALQDRYQRRVRHLVLSLVRDEHLAQDVTQEVFEKVFLKSHLYQPGTCFRAWLLEIARNLALSSLRERRHLPRPISSFDGDDELPRLEQLAFRPDERVPEERELMAAFRRAVASLPERYQAVFHLCALRGLEYREAARLLDVPVGTVAIRLLRARRRLFEALSPLLGRLRRPPACLQ
jgi:RNA polymerase sigma-70 factor (ECF subfamily)